MEGNKKGIIILIIILIIAVIGLSGYIVYDKVISKETVNDENNKLNDTANEDNNKQDDTVNEEDNNTKETDLILEEDYNYYFNNKMHKITYKYYYKKCTEEKCQDPETKYYIQTSVFLDNKKINKDFITEYGTAFVNNLNKIKDMIIYGYDLWNGSRSFVSSHPYGRENLKILESNDAEYLVITIDEAGEFAAKGTTLLIVNDSGTVIKNFNVMSGYYQSVTIKDNAKNGLGIKDGEDYIPLGLFGEKQFSVAYENLYYFETDCPRVYVVKLTINNGKINEKKFELNKDDYYISGEDCW